MERTREKDLYSILGVSADATAEEMREAYFARTRVIHPDRFDPQRQPRDWKKANEMLRELNEAYSILGDATSRAQYDDLRAGEQQRQRHPPPSEREREPPVPPPFEMGELTPGQAAFGNLPKNVQSRLLKRQQNKGEDQFQIKLSSVLWNYVFIGVLLCWFGYLFADADGAKWRGDTLFWYGVITLAVGALIGRNCVTISTCAMAKLKPYFYVTPIYFVKTEFDIVSFRPIWTLTDVAVTHNHKNGSYRNSDVVLKFDGYSESLSLSSKEQVQTLFDSMRTYDTRLRAAYASQDQGYFLNNDDFYGVPRSGVPTTVLLSKGKQALIYVACVFLCAIGLIAAIATNEELSRRRWLRHPTPTPTASTPRSTDERVAKPLYPEQAVPSSGTDERVAKPLYPEQAVPSSGSVRTWTSKERVAPFEIKAAQGSHYLLKLVDAYTFAPVLTVFVRSGTTVQVEVPLGTYEVRYASGETWYGYDYLFGPETSYSKADKTFTFEVAGNRISGFTITLYKVAHGNLHTSAIRPTDF
jgi:hypothetical protein